MKIRISKTITLFIIVIAFFVSFISLPLNVNAEGEKKTIRIGYPIQEGLTQIDEDGNYSGYTYEYLEEIAQYTNWEYEFVLIDKDINESLTEMMDMLEKGEIDLMGGMIYSESLAEKYDYAGRNYGNTNTVLRVLYDSDITNLNSSTRTELRVAVIKGATQRQKELNEFCELYKITPVLIECEDDAEQLAVLENGTADAMLDVSASPAKGLRTIASFAPRPFYFTTTKGRLDIISEINSAIDLIEQTDPYYSDDLYEKYFGGNASMFMLTSEEEDYVENSNAIKVGVLLNNPPFQYLDENTNKLKGISIDFLDYISEKSGLTFEYIKADTQDELNAMIDKNEIDVVSYFVSEYSLARNTNIALTKPYMNMQSFAVMKKGTEQNNLEDKEFVYYPDPLNKLEEDYSLKVNSLQEALDKIVQGKVDYTIGNGYSLQYYANQSEYSELSLLPIGTEDYGIGFGIVRPVDKVLLSIFNKAIINIDNSELQNIIYPNTTYNRAFSIKDWIQSNPFTALTIIIIVMTIITILMFRWLRMRRIMNDKVSMDLEKRRQIYELSNDYFFEYNKTENTLMCTMDDKGMPTSITYDLNTLTSSGHSELLIASIRKFVAEISSIDEGVIELEFDTPSQKKNWISITVKSIADQKGNNIYIIGKIKNIQEEKNKEKKLIIKAERDGLTKVYNSETYRTKVIERLKEFKPGQQGAFLLIDADNFKGVNDNFGHLQGDKTLAYIGEILLELTKEKGLSGRIGGDEFTLFYENISTEEVKTICKKIINHSRLYKLDEQQCLSLSIGAICFENKTKYDDLYHMSDEALYKVKNDGKNDYLILCK